MHHADPDKNAALNQLRLNIDQSHIPLLSDQLPDDTVIYLELARMTVIAARLGHNLTTLQRTSPPADRAQHAAPEAGGRSAAAQSCINRCYDSVPKLL
jgi:hypothetical protein